MGKSWKENPNKWKHNKGFQKKQKQRHGHQKPIHVPEPEDFERRSGIGGTNDYAYGM